MEEKKIEYYLDVKEYGNLLNLTFSSDCGKFGTNEILDEFEVTKQELLHILQSHFNID